MRNGPLRSLTQKRDFEAVFREGVNSASRYVVIYARPNELRMTRFGLSVSKKVGNAVVRNRLKRLLRESMRKGSEGLCLDYDFIVIARKSSVEAKLDDFIRDIRKFLSRLRNEKNSNIASETL